MSVTASHDPIADVYRPAAQASAQVIVELAPTALNESAKVTETSRPDAMVSEHDGDPQRLEAGTRRSPLDTAAPTTCSYAEHNQSSGASVTVENREWSDTEADDIDSWVAQQLKSGGLSAIMTKLQVIANRAIDNTENNHGIEMGELKAENRDLKERLEKSTIEVQKLSKSLDESHSTQRELSRLAELHAEERDAIIKECDRRLKEKDDKIAKYDTRWREGVAWFARMGAVGLERTNQNSLADLCTGEGERAAATGAISPRIGVKRPAEDGDGRQVKR